MKPGRLANLAEAIPLAGIRVVVVDDNLTNRRILTDMLWGWGMLPAPAASGPEALAHMRRGVQRGQPYSLVLTDVHMPEMDGFELVKRIHESPELTQPVILMLTSGDRGDDIARCRKLGDFVLSHQAGAARGVAGGYRCGARARDPAGRPRRSRQRQPSDRLPEGTACVLAAAFFLPRTTPSISASPCGFWRRPGTRWPSLKMGRRP